MAVSPKTVRMPFMVGVCLGVNAFPDGYLVVDGPDCMFFKTEYVHGSQDLCSTLLDVEGKHRVAHTLADVINVVFDREAIIKDLIQRVANEAGFVLVTALPVTAITGSQYDRIAREVACDVGKPIIEVPARSLQGDWLDGYGCVLSALARELPLATGGLNPKDVAVVGMLVDRTEADRLADVKEVTRLLEEGAGCRVRSFWPSNRPISHLVEAGNCGTIISLPYGREAARTLAMRTGADLIEVELPFGVQGSVSFVERVASALGSSERAKDFLRRETDKMKDALSVARESALDGLEVVAICDPHIGKLLPQGLSEIGISTKAILSTAYPETQVAGLPGAEAFVPGLDVDLCLTNTRGIEIAIDLGLKWFEFGFPSYGTHALAEGPLLGFTGMLNFTERLANHWKMLHRWR